MSQGATEAGGGSVATTAPVITIDGPSGTGKGTIAALVAGRLGWHLLDSGALYRSLGVAARRAGVDLDDGTALGRLARQTRVVFDGGGVRLDGEEVSVVIRRAEAGVDASRVAVHAEVRAVLLDWQRAAGRPPGLVADGRDMGSRVFPYAIVKVFLDAAPEERARRRYKQLKDKGLDANLPHLVRELRERDARDRQRAHSPLIVPDGALVVDSTDRSIEQVLGVVMSQVERVLANL